MDALVANMAQHEVLLDRAEKELETTESRLDVASAKESLTKLARAKQKFDD